MTWPSCSISRVSFDNSNVRILAEDWRYLGYYLLQYDVDLDRTVTKQNVSATQSAISDDIIKTVKCWKKVKI
jgi:hypothetical protein